MAGIIKNQILKHLSRFLKKGSMGTDRINISTFKGEGEMQNLELDEMVMTELLSLPTWLRIKRAHCNYVKLRIPWAHLKNVPIQLFLDEVQIELETLEQLRPSESSTVPSYSSGGKYGFADKVVDGATVSVNSVSITLTSKAFLATIQLSRILLESRTPHFKRGELRATRVKDMDRGLILLFKQLSWETSKVEARSTLNPTLSPLRLIANESTARISIKKSLNDCSVLACRLILILKKQHYVLTDSQLKATHTFLISVAHLIREAQEQAKGQKAARKFKPPSRRRPSVPKQNPPASSQLRKASGLIPTLLRRGSFVTTPHATQSLPTTPPAKGRQGKPPHRRKTSASIDQSPRPNTLTPAAARSQPLRSAAAGGKPTKPHSAFDYFDVLETSYHLYAESLELHICDDPGESSSKHPDLLSGGTLHLWFSCLQLDFYPYHLLSSGRSHWFRYHPNQLSDWAVDDLARFQEQLHLLTSSATKGHVPVHRTDGPQSFSNSVPHSPRGERRLSASTASNFSTLMATCVVLRIPEFCIDNVSTSQRTHVTEFITGCKTTAPILPDKTYRVHMESLQFYYPGNMDFPVPASKVYLTVSPLQIRVDPLTLCWLNAFAANLLEGAEEAAEFAPPVDYVELRVEAIMPTVILEAPPFPLPPPPSRPRHPPTPRQPKEKGLPDRPTALHITASRVVATNSRQGPVGSRHQLDFTLNHLQKELFDGNCVGWSRVSSSAEEEEEDLDPIHDRFRRHAQGDDVPLFPRFPLSKSSLWSDPLDVWFLQLSPLFASFTTNRQQGEDLQVVLNPIPVELWLYDSRLPTPVPATGSSSSLEAESSCSAHINVICNLTSLASVLLTRQQYLFLMRIVDDLTVLMDTMESDTIRITGKPNATKAVASIYIPAVDVSFAAPPVFPGATSEIPEINSDPCLFDGVVQSAGVDVPSPLSQDSEPFSGQLFNKLPPIPSSYQLSPQRPHPLDPLVTSTQHDPESPGLNRIPMSLGGRSNIFLDQSSSVFKRGDRSGSMPFVLDTSYLEDDSVSVISSDSDSFVITSSAASTVGDGEYHSLLLDTETPTGNRQAPAMNAGVDEVEEACEALSNELDEESSCEGPYAGNGVTRNLKKNKPRPMSIKSEKEISKGLDQITCVNFRVGQIQVVAQVRDSKTLAKVLCSHVSHQDQPPLLWEELVAEFGRKSKEWRDSFPELTKNCDIKLRCCVSPVSKPLCQPFDETLISISPEKIKNLTQRFAKALEDVPPVDIWKDIVSHGGMFMEADIQDLSLTLMASSSLVLANFFEEEMLKPSLPIKLSLSRVRLTLPDDKPSFNPPLLVSLGDVTVLRDCLGVVHILPLKDLIHHRDESRSQGNFSSKRPLGQQEGGGGGKETEAELRARLKAAEERIKKLTLALQNSERDLLRLTKAAKGSYS